VAANGPSVAVVGHVEWVQFARVRHVPRAGEVAHARDPFEEPAGGGAVAAVQLARLAGEAVLFTALGDDAHGRRSVARLEELGVRVRPGILDAPTRRAITLVDDAGERTITTLGARLEPRGDDPDIDWSLLEGVDAVYFTAGDLDALRAARRAPVLVASPRAGEVLEQGVELDVLVLSGDDPIERLAATHADRASRLIVMTEGRQGGSWRSSSGDRGRWAAVPPTARTVDTYGCGDSFAGGLTYGLAAGLELAAALDLAARCGTVCMTGRGPYSRQLGGPES
jgi:ribokinase